MTDCEAEKAFREMLPCETAKINIHSGMINKLGVPIGITIERHRSLITNTFLIFENGNNSIVRYQANLLRLAE